jgi:hypothetical protein
MSFGIEGFGALAPGTGVGSISFGIEALGATLLLALLREMVLFAFIFLGFFDGTVFHLPSEAG